MRLQNRIYLTALLFVFFLSITSVNPFTQTEDNRVQPNIIIYLADDQDQLDYGVYGNPNVVTTNADRLASEGMKFLNFYSSQAICAPSRSQIFTGMYPVKNGCMANHIGVKPNIQSIATLLKESDYEVVLAGKSHVKPNNVFDWTYYFPKVNNRYLPLEKVDEYLQNAKKPFCLILASDFPHGPYPKNTKYSKSDIYKLPYDPNYIGNHKPGYYQNIEDDNDQLGAVLKMVDKHNLNENSLFIYASDHGLSGKWSLQEQGLKVPFIARWPSKIKANSTSETMLSLVDVLPTILEITDTKIPDDIDGRSFYQTLQGSKEKVNDYLFGVSTRQNIRGCKIFPSRSVRNSRYKLIVNYNSIEVYKSNLGDNEVVNAFIESSAKSFPDVPYYELYDLMNDPYQQENLAKNKNYSKQKKQLLKVLSKWMNDQNDFIVNNPATLIKPTLHPLDKNSNWNTVPEKLVGKLKEEDYARLHY